MNRWLLIGAAAFALLAGALVFALLANVGSDDGGGGRGVSVQDGGTQVLVAKQTIGIGTDVTAEMFELTSFEEGSIIVPDYVDDVNALIGRQAAVEILAGQQISARYLVGGDGDAADIPGIGPAIPPGMRAYSLSISEDTAVGGLIVPGDRVDLIVRYSTKTSPGAPDKQVHIAAFASNVLVLARGQEDVEGRGPIASEGQSEETEQPAVDAGAALRPDDIDPDPGAATLTLALTPQQVLEIGQFAVLEDGQISVALRRFGDDAPFGVEPVIVTLFEQ